MLRSNYSHALKVSLRVSDEVVSEICRFRVCTLEFRTRFREDSFAFLGSPSKGRKKFFETSRSIRCADGKIEENIEQATPIGFQRREYLALFSLSLSLSLSLLRPLRIRGHFAEAGMTRTFVYDNSYSNDCYLFSRSCCRRQWVSSGWKLVPVWIFPVLCVYVHVRARSRARSTVHVRRGGFQ